MNHLPELLAPAGSPDALAAALSAGADAVYLGGTRFNARMSAKNFDAGALGEAVTHAHREGGRVYLTLNTLVWDRELSDAVAAAYEAALAGVDGLIIADLGAASLIRRALPELPLHASTQLSGHNAAAGEALAPLGFTRFVIARETRFCDLAAAVQNNPLEVEVFVHGALCVSHSGQCLFSSIVGGRSGNRGECAQPCRLPYACGSCPPGTSSASKRKGPTGKGRDAYPLSLKDLTLAAHVPALLDAGVASLKIEGRMKSPGYVSGVVAIWRRLLDERRGVTEDELRTLEDLFSRGGFTDGYQTGILDHPDRGHGRMMGVRSEDDKGRSAAAERLALSRRPVPRLESTMALTVEPDEPVRLTVSAPLYRGGDSKTVSVTVEGDIPTVAAKDGATLDGETAARQLTRTGGTPYTVTHCRAAITPGLSVPLSRLNALRRDALDALDAARRRSFPDPAAGYAPPAPRRPSVIGYTPPRTTARFRTPAQIPAEAVDHLDILYLPLGITHPAHVPPDKRGVILPPVIFDREAPATRESLSAALRAGARHVLMGNIGHLSLVREAAQELADPSAVHIHGDFRLNAANAEAAEVLFSLGFCDLLSSAELTLPRLRDLCRATGRVGAIIYGRLPLMILEKCAIRETYAAIDPTVVCRDICGRDRAVLCDRLGKEFPLLRESGADRTAHRTLVVNSLPLSMSDRPDDLSRIPLADAHFLFTVESAAEVARVFSAYRTATPIGGEVRRLK